MISQRLSLNMPKLNQNERIQALTMLARGDNVSNVSRAFGCHRHNNSVTKPRTDRFITLTHLRRRFQTVTSSVRQYGISKQTVLGRLSVGKPSNRFGQGGPMWDKCLLHVIGYPFAVGTTAFPLGGDSCGLGFYSLMSLGLTLVIMTVEFEFLEEEGNVSLIIVSLRGTDLEVGVLLYGVALWTGGKQISLLCKATSMLKVTLTRFCSQKLFLSF